MTGSEWSFVGDVVIPPQGLDVRQAHKFIFEALLDGHIPVIKPIGYTINSGGSGGSNKLFERDNSCLENRIDIASSLMAFTFYGLTTTTIRTARLTGDFNVFTNNKAKFIIGTREIDTYFTTVGHVYTSTRDMELVIKLREDVGFHDTGSNYTHSIQEIQSPLVDTGRARSTKSRYLPLQSYHCLIDYARVTPYDGDGIIHIRYYNGMTPELLSKLFTHMFEIKDTLISNKEEREWWDKYGY